MEWHPSIVNIIVVKIAIRHLGVTSTSLNNDEPDLIMFSDKTYSLVNYCSSLKRS